MIIPRDPLIFGDGRSFTTTPGERSKSLAFPFPSTLAGAVRTLAGTDVKSGFFDKGRIFELKQILVRGPVLAELSNDESRVNWLFPAPSDALIVEAGDAINKTVSRYALSPFAKSANEMTDLVGLDLVGPNQRVKDKPLSNPPRFWLFLLKRTQNFSCRLQSTFLRTSG